MMQPHGGKLVNRLLDERGVAAATSKAKSLQQIAVSSGVLTDMENIARGVYSPIEGFMTAAQVEMLFQAIPKVPNIEARGSYDKVHIVDLDDFFEIEDVDTLVKGELLYHMNPNLTIAYIYEKRFEEEDGIIGGIESTTVQTRIHF